MNIAEFYNKLNDKERKVFYVAIAALVLAFFDMLFLRPVLSRLADLEEKIHSTTIDIEKNIRFISYRDKIMAEQEAFQQYETGEDKIGEEVIAGFLKTIETLAVEAGVGLSRVTPAEVNDKKGSVLYYANVDCSGKLEDMITFMHRINTTNNLLKIIRMNMMGNKASKEEVKGELKVAKLVINPATIGNYEFNPKEKDKVPQRELDNAAASIGLRSGGVQSSSFGRSGGNVPQSGSLSGHGSGRAGGSSGQGGPRRQPGAAGDIGGASSGSGQGNVSGEEINSSSGSGVAAKGASDDQALTQGTTKFQQSSAVGGADSGMAARPVNSAMPVNTPGTQSEIEGDNGQVPVDNAAPKKEGIQIEGIESLWSRFVSKITGKEDLPPIEDGVYIPDDYGQEDERNLWERKMR